MFHGFEYLGRTRRIALYGIQSSISLSLRNLRGMQRLYIAGIILILPFLLSQEMFGQVSVYPTELYSGENVVTFKVPGGIRSIRTEFDSLTAGMTEFHGIGGIGDLGGCPDSQQVQIRVNTASMNLSKLDFVITDCNGREHRTRLTNRTWRLDEVFFPDTEIGDTICRPFQISLSGGVVIGGVPLETATAQEYLDSVSVPIPQAHIRYSFPPPLKLQPNSVYRYTVCFTADREGVYRFPVQTWIRRRQPAGGYTNYIVADTGVIRVFPKRPGIDVTTYRLDTIGSDNPTPVTDPTTFRTVAIPNAVIPPRGRWFVGNYDLLGFTGGYSVADELMIFAGGAPPLPDDWLGVNGDLFWAAGAGVKVGTSFGKFNIAGGYAFAMSTLDKEFTPDETDSRITLNIPYAALSYGTDDSRVSITGGAAFKHHSTWVLNDVNFGDYRVKYDTTAYFGALGADYRFAKHWKVAGEFMTMQTLDLAPLLVTARYFTNTFAIDAGMAYAGITLNDAEQPKFPFAPVISAVFVF